MTNHRQDPRQRLNGLLPRALDRLESLLEPRDECEACGRSDDDPALVRAIENILDRTGHGRSATVMVDQSSNLASLQALNPHQLLARAEATVASLRAKLYPAEPQKLLPASDVIEAEVTTRVVPERDSPPPTEDPSSSTSESEAPMPEPEAPAPVACKYCHRTPTQCTLIFEKDLDTWRVLHYKDPAEVARRIEIRNRTEAATAGRPLPDWFRS